MEVSKSGGDVKVQKKKVRRRKKKDKGIEFDKIPGVIKMVLSPEMQKQMGCIVGEQVTGENPWLYVDKEFFEDDLEFHEGSSMFLPIKQEVQEYPDKQLLIGYVPNDSSEVEEFYICTTKAAFDTVFDIIEKMREEHEDKMRRAVSKDCKHWQSMGSENEIKLQQLLRNRALYEVEIESKYPIMISKAHFKIRNAEDCRDGYSELLQGRVPITVVSKKRIDAAVQAAAINIEREVQTICPYPKNAWTQYEYYYTECTNLSEECKKNIKEFIGTALDGFCDDINVSGNINFYSDDYQKLICNKQFTKAYQEVLIREFMSFTDTKLCKDKMISSVSWHPFFTGVVVCSYADTALNNYFVKKPESNESSKVIYNKNPVLVWSFVDGLKPKLILEAHREITSIAYCPYDDGIVIGGCRNGQIIIWDVAQKLQKVEEEEITSPTLQKYRNLMWSFMTWMKNIKNIAYIPAAAITDLEYSHKSTVSSIQWLPPDQELTKTGHIRHIDLEQGVVSYQFATSSLDGDIMFWDLRAKPHSHGGDYRPQRRLRRLKRRPSALTMDVSPYRALHRIFKPIYKLQMRHLDNSYPIPLTCFALPHYFIKYEETNPDPKRKNNPLIRIGYKPILEQPYAKYDQSLVFGSADGVFGVSTWDGYEYLSGQVVAHENANISNIGKYHDSPISSTVRWPISSDIILTVGGKVFCIWQEQLNSRPILWRKNMVKYTHGDWNTEDPTTFKLMRADGIFEIWGLYLKSSGSLRQQTLSGNILTGSYTQQILTTVLAVADYNGSLRIYHTAEAQTSELKCIALKNWFTTQVKIIRDFFDWQTTWINRHAGHIQILREEALQLEKLKKEQEEIERLRQEEEKERLLKELAKQEALKLKAPPGQFKEWAENKWREREQGRMNKVLLHLKQLNPKTLREQQAPLKKIEAEEAQKRRKQAQKHANSEKIFNESVAMYFPHVLKKKPLPPRDPYAGGDSLEMKQGAMANYKLCTADVSDFIKMNPFIHHFDWPAMNKTGLEKFLKQALFHSSSKRMERHEKRKLDREIQEQIDAEYGGKRYEYNDMEEEEEEEEEDENLIEDFEFDIPENYEM